MQDTLEESHFEQTLPQLYRAVLQQFKHITASFVFFNAIFLFLLVAEILAILIFFPFLMQSTLLAISLSGFFLTIFCYFILQFYYAAKKPEQLLQLKEQFVSSCHQVMRVDEDDPSQHLAIASALTQLAAYLEEFEWQIYRIPSFLQPLKRPLSLLSAFCHWQDVFHFKQVLLHAAVEEHLAQIRNTPTALDVHISLANTYLTLSQLYTEPKCAPNPYAFRKQKEQFNAQFQTAARLAIEEFRIIGHFAPDDPWVHEQLAQGYRSLHRSAEEQQEIELLLQLRPNHPEHLFRLGTLHFEQGRNAEGLKIYKALQENQHPEQAKLLIASYGKSNTSPTA